jgi:hypothetical protein
MAEEKKTDYQGNAKKQTEKQKVKEDDKPLEPVVTNTVMIKKRPMSRRFKDFVTRIDVKTVGKYVLLGTLVPAAKAMVFDAGHEVLRRIMYPNSPDTQGRFMGGGVGGPTRYNYQTPISRPYSQQPAQYSPATVNPQALRLTNHFQDEIILVDQRDAEAVLGRMYEVLEQVQIVTVRDLKELLGRPSAYTDDGWGWNDLQGSRVVAIPQGYLIELPQARPVK